MTKGVIIKAIYVVCETIAKIVVAFALITLLNNCTHGFLAVTGITILGAYVVFQTGMLIYCAYIVIQAWIIVRRIKAM